MGAGTRASQPCVCLCQIRGTDADAKATGGAPHPHLVEGFSKLMDGERFDDLVKRLSATRLTRVSVLRGLAAGTIATLTGAVRSAHSGDATVLAAPGTCRNLGHPCEGQQDCCAGIEACNVTGPGNAKRCEDVPGCGAITEPCCPGDTCEAGLECDPDTDTCVEPDPECGAVGQECCDGDPTCDPGGICVDNDCVACGDLGEPCCDNETCNTTDLTCSEGGTCIECGLIGLPCCEPGEGDFCEEGAVCDPSEGPDGTCVACGGRGQLCCEEGDECDNPLICLANGTCGEGTPSPPPPGRCTSDLQCPGGFCRNGQCFFIQGLRCKSGETPEKCCIRSVKKGCKRKQQTGHARQNCLKRGKKRCKKLLRGIA